MKRFRSGENFNPLDHATPLTQDQMNQFGIADYTRPKPAGNVDGIPLMKQSFTMQDEGWKYDTVSTVLSKNQRVTDVSNTMTGGWFTGEYGFNRRRQGTLAKFGIDSTFVSVPTNLEKGWGSMESNAKAQVQIGMAHAAMFGLNQEVFVSDGLSRGAIHSEAVMGVAPELGALYAFGYNTVACRINAAPEVEDLAELLYDMNPINLGRAAIRGDLSQISHALNVPRIIGVARDAKNGISEAFGGELQPLKNLVVGPLKMIKEGASIDEAVMAYISKLRPDSAAIPWKILSRYPASGDLKRFWRQILEAYDLTNGSYGKLAGKASTNQFRVHVGFLGDGLSKFEEIVAAYDLETHPNTIVEIIDKDKAPDERGAHLTSIVEGQHQLWKGDWKAMAEALAALTPLIEAYSDRDSRGNRGASTAQVFSELRAEAAKRNTFYESQVHIEHTSDFEHAHSSAA